MPKYSLAVVCLLGLMAGGAAALALHYARRGAVEVRGVAVERPDVGLEAGAEAVAAESPAGEDAGAGDGETSASRDVAADEVEDGTGVSARKANRYEARARVRAERGEPAGDSARATRRYARASGRQVAAGGRGLGGRALGGVKKTGEGVKKTGVAVGKTVGKIGGIFHE